MQRINFKNILFISISILILINQCSNSLSINSEEINENSNMFFRISNIKWKINDRYSEYYPDYTHVTFTLKVDVWVDSSSDVTVVFPNGCGFIPKLNCPNTFEEEGYACTAALISITFPSGFISYKKQISGWIKEPSALQLPLGIYDFYIKDFEEIQQSYHTYLEITSNGSKISNDPMPTGWDEIDWSEKDWGYENINLEIIGEYNGNHSYCNVAKDVVVKDDIAYIAKGCHGIEIIDIKNPIEPSFISLYNTNFSNSFALKIDLYDKYAVCSTGFGGILILDVSNPSTPEYINIINNFNSDYPYIENFKIFNDLLVLPVNNDGLYIWEISNPSNLNLISHFSKDLIESSVSIQDDKIFLSCARNGFLILDISDIYSPKLIGNYSCYANNVVVNKDLAYLANYTGIMILDVSDPLNIDLVNFFGDKFYHTLKFDNDYLYGIIRDEGLEIFNISNNEEQNLIGRFYNQGKMHGIFIDEKFIYLANGYSDLVILDKNFEPLEYSQPTKSIPNFNNFYLAFGMVLGVIYILSKLRAKINRINPNILKI